jgi:hypothetical protein
MTINKGNGLWQGTKKKRDPPGPLKGKTKLAAFHTPGTAPNPFEHIIFLHSYDNLVKYCSLHFPSLK